VPAAENVVRQAPLDAPEADLKLRNHGKDTGSTALVQVDDGLC
jgi:hypothetical protein